MFCQAGAAANILLLLGQHVRVAACAGICTCCVLEGLGAHAEPTSLGLAALACLVDVIDTSSLHNEAGNKEYCLPQRIGMWHWMHVAARQWSVYQRG